MKVLYFSKDYTPHDHRFLSSLADSGQETFFLRLGRGPRQTEDRPLPEGVELLSWDGSQRPFRGRDVFGAVLALRRLAREVEPDVIHAGPLHSAALVAALDNARPLVSMSWGSDLLVDARRSAWMKNLTRLVLRRSDALVGDCQAVKETAVEFGFPEERVTLFPWGLDLGRFQPADPADSELRARLGWQDCVVALSLRSWEPIYGVDCVVRGFARAAERDERLRLILLGGGSLAGQIQGLLAKYGLHGRVHLGGTVSNSDLPRYYQAADLYLSASHSDGSSVSLMEALACGLPALVSDIPGNREWIEEGRQGWLFPDGDPEALAAKLARAADQAEALAPLSAAARCRAEERANWPENFKKLLAAYEMAAERAKCA